jgi:hypothetical protein
MSEEWLVIPSSDSDAGDQVSQMSTPLRVSTSYGTVINLRIL